MKRNVLRTIVLFGLFGGLIGMAILFGCKLYCYYEAYTKDRDLYQDLRNEIVKKEEDTKAEQILSKEETKNCLEDSCFRSKKKHQEHIDNALSVPFSVDWDKLKAINKDIIGWVYFTGLPQISYPVLQAKDNAYYVNRTFDLSCDTSKAGSIFMDYRMASDFSSPYSIIYGHTIRDGSMLSDLVQLKNQDLYDKEPYFWILTPNGNYCYQIFSIFQCYRSADVFQKEFDTWGSAFSDWLTTLKNRTVMKGECTLSENGHVIAFSTCVPDSFDRTIVCGTYVSGDPIPEPQKTN